MHKLYASRFLYLNNEIQLKNNGGDSDEGKVTFGSFVNWKHTKYAQAQN